MRGLIIALMTLGGTLVGPGSMINFWVSLTEQPNHVLRREPQVWFF
jgi:hypothetical protein